MAFNDPLKDLIRKEAEATGQTPPESISAASEEPNINSMDIDDDIYGKGDLAREIEQEEAEEAEDIRRTRELMAEMREREEEKLNQVVIDSNNKEYQDQAIGFQGDKLAVVTTMVNKVIAKYHIVSGAVPDKVRMKVMGELIDIYHREGEVITPEFEEILLSNWELPSGITAKVAIENNTLNTMEEGDQAPAPTQEASSVSVEEEEDQPVNININVEPDTPVTVNVDEGLISELSRTKVVNVNVKEITNRDLLTQPVITNSKIPGIIKPYKYEINNVPITLPMSAYRCTCTGLNYFEVIELGSPTSGTLADTEMKNWSIIYKHLKNPSIGEFKNFEEFLKCTKYADREMLMWAILTATVDNEEEIGIQCSNPDCDYRNIVKYSPRNVIHLDETKIPDYYQDVHEVSVGDAARALHNEISGKAKRITLPDSQISLDIKTPSAYDYIYKKIPIMAQAYRETHFGNEIENSRGIDNSDALYSLLVAVGLYVEAAYVPHENKVYKYDSWEDIKTIATTALSPDDTVILLNMVSRGDLGDSPAEYYIEDVVCPNCGKHDKRATIRDIFSELLFRASRKLQNTQVNLIDKPLN